MKKTTLIIGLGMLAILEIILTGCARGDSVKQSGVSTNTLEFTVKAFRFGYSPDVIELNKGDKVRIKVENTDTTHGIRIPDLNLKGNNTIEFTADKEGEFNWYCNVMCGEGHKEMGGKLIIK